MKINGRKLGSFRIKKKNIIKVDSIEQNGPKLVLTIDKFHDLTSKIRIVFLHLSSIIILFAKFFIFFLS